MGAKKDVRIFSPFRHLSATVPPANPRSFLESMEQQFWVVGGDRIQVQIQGKTHVFGKQLDPERPSCWPMRSRRG